MKPALLLLLSLSLLAACQKEAAEPKISRAAEPIIEGDSLRFPANHPQLAMLTLSEAKGQTESDTLSLPAKLIWDEARTQRITPALSGRVASMNVDVGQSVKAGQVLASLASPDLGQAQAELAKANADLHLSQQQQNRQQQLLDLGIIARKDLELAQAERARAEAEHQRAQSKVSLYGAGKDMAIKSQLAGVVVERNVNPGQEIRPDQYGPQSPSLFVVSDPTRLWVAIDLPEKHAAAVRVGMPFELKPKSLPGEIFKGTILSIADHIDPNTRFIRVRGQVDNPERHLKAEMLADVAIAKPASTGIYVPAKSVLFSGNQHSVYVSTSDGVFRQKAITLDSAASAADHLVAVKSGLNAGEKVVSENVLLLSRMMAQKKELH